MIESKLELTKRWAESPDSSLWNQKEIALILDMSPKTLEQARWKGDGFPYIKIQGKIRYKKEEIMKALTPCNNTSEYVEYTFKTQTFKFSKKDVDMLNKVVKIFEDKEICEDKVYEAALRLGFSMLISGHNKGHDIVDRTIKANPYFKF
jgi:hypothetical protein